MEDRKARIAALRAKAGRPKAPPLTETEAQHQQHPVLQILTLLSNNNNDTTTTSLPLSKRQRRNDNTDKTKKKEESVLIKALRLAQAEAKRNAGGGALEDLAPKKINADLKREIQPKLDKLERRTQKAIVALLRERLEREAAAEIDD